MLRGNDWKLYDLIWKRTVASQMADAKGSTASVTIAAGPTGPSEHPDAAGALAEFSASGTVITFRGFMHAYEESHDEERNEAAEPTEAKLPPLTEGQSLKAVDVEAKGHETSPPPRYTEASLVKTLEELGIGRPSTYASIISTIIDRGYVTPRGQALVPNWIAFSVVRLLEEYFADLVRVRLHRGHGRRPRPHRRRRRPNRVDWLTGFYFGSDKHRGLRTVIDNLGEIDAREINSIKIADDITLRIGKYGPYLEVDPEADPDATPRRVNIPPDLAPDELTAAKARELIDAPVVADRVIGVNPENGKNIVAKDGRFGPYVTELEPDPEPETGSSRYVVETVDPATGEVVETKPKKKKPPAKKVAAVKPRTASIFKSMDLADRRPRHRAAPARPAARRGQSTRRPATRSPPRTASSART